MKIPYQEWHPRPASLALVGTAENIIDEYEDQGYTLTLRQLYYQFVARDIIPNTERSYKNLGNLITKARMAGLISWSAIEDRTREHHAPYIQEDITEHIEQLEYYIDFDQWARQDTYVEVWVEKEALGNVIEKACAPWMVPHMACKGYLSASEAWRAGRRFRDARRRGKNCVMIHLGDHDPSGIDMTRDNRDRLSTFAEQGVTVSRIALNMDQIEHYRPPENPTKLSDSRAENYIQQYGHASWELDALEPAVMEKLIEDEIKKHLDMDVWEGVRALQQEKRALVRQVSDNWDAILERIEDGSL